MFDIGGGELLLIVVAILVFFGPKKIPEFAKMWRKGINEVRKAQGAFRDEINNISKDVTEDSNPKEKKYKIEE